MTTSERDGSPADDRQRLEREVANSNSLILSQLPAEIRNEIWRLTLPDVVSLSCRFKYSWRKSTDSDLEYLSRSYSEYRSNPNRLDGQFMLLRICRQMRSEIASVYFGETTFVLGISQTLDRNAENCLRRTIGFINAIEHKAARLFRHIVLIDSSFPLSYDKAIQLDLKLGEGRPVVLWSTYNRDSPTKEALGWGSTYQQEMYPREAEIQDVLRSLTLKSDGMAKEDITTRCQLLSWFRSFSSWGEVLSKKYADMARAYYWSDRPYDMWVARRAKDVSKLARAIDGLE